MGQINCPVHRFRIYESGPEREDYYEIWEKSNERYVVIGTAWNIGQSDRMRKQQ